MVGGGPIRGRMGARKSTLQMSQNAQTVRYRGRKEPLATGFQPASVLAFHALMLSTAGGPLSVHLYPTQNIRGLARAGFHGSQCMASGPAQAAMASRVPFFLWSGLGDGGSGNTLLPGYLPCRTTSIEVRFRYNPLTRDLGRIFCILLL